MSDRTPAQLRRLTRDTLFMGPEPYFAHCTRCGARVDKPPFPIAFDGFKHYSLYVMALHADCAPNAPAPELVLA